MAIEVKFVVVDDSVNVKGSYDTQTEGYQAMKVMSTTVPGKRYWLCKALHEFYTPTEAEKANKELWK